MSRSYTISTGYVLNSVILHVGCAKSTFICLSGLSSLVTWAILFPISVQSQASYTPSTFIIHSNCSCCALSSPRADLNTDITSFRKFSGASLYGVNCSDLCITSTLLSTWHILLPFSRCPPMDLALLERPLSTILDKHSSF